MHMLFEPLVIHARDGRHYQAYFIGTWSGNARFVVVSALAN
jgi:hypothetical protein